MLRYVLFETTMFESADDVEQTRKDLCWLLEALTQRNQDYLKQRPNTPRLYKSGVKYEIPKQFDGEVEEVRILREALGRAARKRDVRRALELVQMVLGGERFRDIGRVIENGGGDCDNLATWRAAELRQAGIPARPFMTHREQLGGGTVYHALVLWPAMPGVPYVTSEDPSLLLGMGGDERIPDREEEKRKNAERCEHLTRAFGGMAGLRERSTAIEDILGLRRGRRPDASAAVAEIEQLLRRRVA